MANEYEISSIDDYDSTSLEIVKQLQYLDDELQYFNTIIYPELNKLGYQIFENSFSFGVQSIAQLSRSYNSVLTKINNQGFYTSADLSSLQSYQTGMQYTAYAAAIGMAAGLGVTLFNKVKKFVIGKIVEHKIKKVIENEQDKIPEIYNRLDKIGQFTVTSRRIIEPIFNKHSFKIARSEEERRNIHDIIDILLNRIQSNIQINSKYDYLINFYETINNFDKSDFHNSLESIIKAGTIDKIHFELQCLNLLDEIERRLDESLYNINSYFQNGLPEILVYLVRNRKNENLFPKGFKNNSYNNLIKRIRYETVKTVNPKSIILAYSYSRDAFGSPLFVFKYHLFIIGSLFLIFSIIIVIQKLNIIKF